MKRMVSILLSCVLVFSGCSVTNSSKSETSKSSSESAQEAASKFKQLNDPELATYIEDTLYAELVDKLESNDYFVENIEARYVSKEYLEELSYNSSANIYFGYSLADIEASMQGKKYIFTLSDDGNTIVRAFEAYDDTFDQVVRNVCIGSGVILVCVTVSVVTAGVGAPAAVSMVFAISAKTAATAAVSGGVLSAAVAGATTGIQTGDMDAAIKTAALSGSEGFMWGAIGGAITGAASETYALYGMSRNGLTMSEAATIQRSSKYPIDTIKNIGSIEEAAIYEKAGLSATKVGGKNALVQKVDWDLTDEFGRTNRQRVLEHNLSPIAKDGTAFELHHIGQKPDSPLAILTKEQHRLGENYSTLHANSGPGVHSEVESAEWAKQVSDFWKAYLQATGG